MAPTEATERVSLDMDALGPGDPTEIGGHRLVGRLGAGGMGVVYRAITADGEPVAIKVIRGEYADDPEFRRRFAAEVAACQKVTGDCTARVLAADATATTPYLVTEFVAGQSLSERVAERGPLSSKPLRALALGLAQALEAIHATGLVHRDLKPSNVLLSAQGLKVVDFGIAAAADGTAVTRSGQLQGSPGWMAPEQIFGHGVGPALDVFSWGLVVGYAATGRPPFGVGRSDVVLYRIVHTDPDLTGLDPFLAPLVDRAVAKNPADRPTVPELLAEVLHGRPPGAPGPSPQTSRPGQNVLARRSAAERPSGS